MKKLVALLFWAVFNIFMQSFTTHPVSAETVYICMTGEVYHSTKNCRGLQRCKSSIKSVTEKQAIKKYGRRPCKICY